MKIDRSNNVKSVICLVTKIRRRVLERYLKIIDPVNRRQIVQMVEGVMNTKKDEQIRRRGECNTYGCRVVTALRPSYLGVISSVPRRSQLAHSRP